MIEVCEGSPAHLEHTYACCQVTLKLQPPLNAEI
jgi:hypothetical protein